VSRKLGTSNERVLLTWYGAGGGPSKRETGSGPCIQPDGHGQPQPAEQAAGQHITCPVLARVNPGEAHQEQEYRDQPNGEPAHARLVQATVAKKGEEAEYCYERRQVATWEPTELNGPGYQNKVGARPRLSDDLLEYEVQPAASNGRNYFSWSGQTMSERKQHHHDHPKQDIALRWKAGPTQGSRSRVQPTRMVGLDIP
jgi:hypothetical protein